MRSRWVSLLLITRLPAACVSVGLLLVHDVSEQDAALVVATISWTAITLVAATHLPVVERTPLHSELQRRESHHHNSETHRRHTPHNR